MRIVKYILILVALLSSDKLFAQVTQEVIHKASKKIEKKFDESLTSISVLGEKAVIQINGWDRDYVQLEIKPISRNTNKSKAISDLKFIKYETKIENKQLIIRNFFSGDFKKISSNLNMEINISCPKSLSVKAHILYGPIDVQGISNFETEVSFGSCNIRDISGDVKINAKYSNTRLNHIKGNLIVISEKSDITASELNGNTTMTSNYGNIFLSEIATDKTLKIQANKTNIRLEQSDIELNNYKLQNIKGKIYFPGNPDAIKKSFEKGNGKHLPLVELSTTYCDIEIIEK